MAFILYQPTENFVSIIFLQWPWIPLSLLFHSNPDVVYGNVNATGRACNGNQTTFHQALFSFHQNMPGQVLFHAPACDVLFSFPPRISLSFSMNGSFGFCLNDAQLPSGFIGGHAKCCSFFLFISRLKRLQIVFLPQFSPEHTGYT